MDPLENLQDPILMHNQYIFNLLQTYQNIKFFDIRDRYLFDSIHLRNAIYVPTDSPVTHELLRRISGENELSRLRRSCLIIGYSSAHYQRYSELKQIFDFLKCKEIHLITDFDLFLQTYSFLCSSFRPIKIKQFPNEIIPKTLYLGSQVHAQNREILEILRITHIVNVTRGPAVLFPGISYCRVIVEDSKDEKISVFFRKAFEFIQEALRENTFGSNNIILVHCAQGVSRSSTIVVMFLMKSTGMNLEEALQFVKRHRSIIEPNEGFMKELKEFEDCENQFPRARNSLSNFRDSLEEEVKML